MTHSRGQHGPCGWSQQIRGDAGWRGPGEEPGDDPRHMELLKRFAPAYPFIYGVTGVAAHEACASARPTLAQFYGKNRARQEWWIKMSQRPLQEETVVWLGLG